MEYINTFYQNDNEILFEFKQGFSFQERMQYENG